MSLVKTWLQACADSGLSKADALRQLNAKLGTKYQHNALSRWERGEREPSPEARVEMLRLAVPWLMKDQQYTANVINKMVEALR